MFAFDGASAARGGARSDGVGLNPGGNNNIHAPAMAAQDSIAAYVPAPSKGASDWADEENPGGDVKIHGPTMADVPAPATPIPAAATDKLPSAGVNLPVADGRSIAAERGLVQMGDDDLSILYNCQGS